MGFGFLNIWMLLGLSTLVLPVLAHLISKRRFDVVQWGAMRFLELGQRTRRRIRLQDWLLLLLRMVLLGCVALALCRPWGSGGLLSTFAPRTERDYVFVLDGSGSMAWQNGPGAGGGGIETPHAEMLQWVHNALEEIGPGDTVALVDARQQPRRLTAAPTTDPRYVREALTGLADPAGVSRIPIAIEDALKILATASHASRRVVVLSDNQKLAWEPEDELAWTRIDEFRKQTQFTPSLSVVQFGETDAPRTNFSVGRIELSREITVPQFPVKVRAMIRQSGGTATTKSKVTFRVDGQIVPEKTIEIDLLPNSEASVSFDHVFATEGHFLISIGLEPDRLPQDNISEAVVEITSSIPILLVDGDRRIDQNRSETFYLQSLFAASGSQSPWIKTTTIQPHELTDLSLDGQQAAFLCNVSRLTERQWETLRKFVREGGGLVIAPGDKVDAAEWNAVIAAEKSGFLPGKLQKIVQETAPDGTAGVTTDSLSLEVPWLQRFRRENGVDFSQTRFEKWWRLEPIQSETDSAELSVAGTETPAQTSEPDIPVQILARLSSGDPLILRRDEGYGSVLLLAIPLDADWSTLPAKNDFVPFVHELVFALNGRTPPRNVSVGTPILLPLKPNENPSDFLMNGPGISNQPVELTQRGRNAFARFRHTTVPGIYRFIRKNDPATPGQVFVVDDEHLESDLTPLLQREWDSLYKDGRMTRVKTMSDVTKDAAGEAPRTEVWWLLLILVLVLLVCEVALTRKMVQGGRASIEEAFAS